MLSLGADLIGENRVQEFLGKRDALALDGVECHLIGHLQTNKVRQIAGEVDMIESVSSLKLAIPPICESETQVRRYFAQMKQYFIDIKDKKIDNIDMEILSMGMSGDFEAAVAEGSNIVRVGSAIFGARNYF